MNFKFESSVSFGRMLLMLLVSGGLSAEAQTNVAISIDDVSVVEGDNTIQFIDEFVPPGNGGLIGTGGLTIHSDGNLYVSSGPGDSVLRYDGSSGEFIDAFVTPGSGGLDNPHGFVFGPDGNLYVTSQDTDEVLRFNGATGALIDAFIPAGSGGLDQPKNLAFGKGGDLLVTSAQTNEVLRFDENTGAFIGVFVVAGSGLDHPIGLLFGSDGNLYVTSAGTGEVLRFDGTTGEFLDTFVTASSGGLDVPIDMLFDSNGDLYVGSGLTDAVLRYDGTTGAYVDAVVPSSNGIVDRPRGMDFDSDGNLYVAGRDSDNVGRFGAASQAAFTVSLSSASTEIVTVNFATADGTATTIDGDYVATSGTVVFDPGVTTRSVVVQTLVDGLNEPDETLFVNLSNPSSGANISNGQGIATIIDHPSNVVVADSFMVTRGTYVSGGVAELAASDNADLSIRRAVADIQSRTEFEVKAVSTVASPPSLEVTLEGAVFARSQVNQTIELFDYSAGSWEQVDTRAATRFSDSTVTVAATGDLSRFVEVGTMCLKARIRYQATRARARFASNTDQFMWTIGQ